MLNRTGRPNRDVNKSSSLRSWRDFASECVCFGSEAVNASGDAVRGLVKSRVAAQPPLARSRIPPATQANHNLPHCFPNLLYSFLGFR